MPETKTPTRDDPWPVGIVATLSALAQPTRLRVYLDLLAALPEGKPSGRIAAATETPPTTMSAHLAVLTRAGLVHAERRGTSIVYAADPSPSRLLADFLGQAVGG